MAGVIGFVATIKKLKTKDMTRMRTRVDLILLPPMHGTISCLAVGPLTGKYEVAGGGEIRTDEMHITRAAIQGLHHGDGVPCTFAPLLSRAKCMVEPTVLYPGAPPA
jgi:hypothetical protein